MTGQCPYPCTNKTEFGYCKTTGCINPQYAQIGTTPGEVITVNDTAHPNWIPCNNRLPETDCDVLIQDEQFFGGSLIAVACFENGKWEWRDDMSTSAKPKPVAWMPLPEPYKGGDTE